MVHPSVISKLVQLHYEARVFCDRCLKWMLGSACPFRFVRMFLSCDDALCGVSKGVQYLLQAILEQRYAALVNSFEFRRGY